MKGQAIRILFLPLILTSACNFDSSGNHSNDRENSTTAAQFSFTPMAGDFWEYRWDHDDSGDGLPILSGRFRITLGTSYLIDGVQFFPLIVAGDTGSFRFNEDGFFPAWSAVAFENHQLLGTDDGLSYRVLFDGETGYWQGGGFFDRLPENLTTTIDTHFENDFVSGYAYRSGIDASSSRCEFIAGQLVCGNSDMPQTYLKYDYFHPDIGVVGHHYFNSYYSTTGGTSFVSHIGLVASSIAGDTVTTELETEPNNAFANATPIISGQTFVGHSSEQADGLLAVGHISDGYLDDLYRFEISNFPKSATISLTFSGVPADTDFDLYLLSNEGTFLAKSESDNLASGDYTETIYAPNLLGTYYIGVNAFTAAPEDKLEYQLTYDLAL